MPGALTALLNAKRAALSAQNFVPKPWFHGTRFDVVPSTRPLWLAEDPDVAALYTGGGRRSTVQQSRKEGRIIPFLGKDTVRDTGLTITADVKDKDAWLNAFGIPDPEQFRAMVNARAEEAARKSFEKQRLDPVYFQPMWDDLGTVGAGSPGFAKNWVPRGWEVLDRAPFREQLIEELGPEMLYMFDHPSSVVKYSKRGVPKVSPETFNANVLWAPSPKDSLRSPFEFKRGGLAQMAGGGQVRKALQQAAKTFGIPGNQSTKRLDALLQVFNKAPNTWTADELRSVAPYLAVHQDVRPGAQDRVESILSQGLKRGMVDPLEGVAFGDGWSWSGGFKDGMAYVYPRGTLKYRSSTSPWLGEGNTPLFYMPTTKDAALEELLQGAKTP